MVARRIRIAIQKKGRLHDDSLKLLKACGLKVRIGHRSLLYHCENLPFDILLVRDDDVPTMVIDRVCDWGIVGENVLQEKTLNDDGGKKTNKFNVIKSLGFGQCRLSIALPQERQYKGAASLNGLRIATSYPQILKRYLSKNSVNAHILPLTGSVEIAPRLDMADAICDLVSTGRTLEENNLVECEVILKSQAILIETKRLFTEEERNLLNLLICRVQGVLQAQESKYILFHAPRSALEQINHLLPGVEAPTVLPLSNQPDKVAVHVVSTEGVFWSTLEKLKAAGASSILVLPIEKILGMGELCQSN